MGCGFWHFLFCSVLFCESALFCAPSISFAMAAVPTPQVTKAQSVALQSIPRNPSSLSNAAVVRGMRKHVQDLHAKLVDFVRDYCDPAIAVYHAQLQKQQGRFSSVCCRPSCGWRVQG